MHQIFSQGGRGLEVGGGAKSGGIAPIQHPDGTWSFIHIGGIYHQHKPGLKTPDGTCETFGRQSGLDQQDPLGIGLGFPSRQRLFQPANDKDTGGIVAVQFVPDPQDPDLKLCRAGSQLRQNCL